MQARQFPLSRGWGWFKDGVLLWRRNPGLATFVTFSSLLVILVIAAIPLIGALVASILMPVFMLTIANAFRCIDEGLKDRPDLLFFGIKRNLSVLVAIGGIYLVASIAVMLLSSYFDNGAMQRAVEAATENRAVEISRGDLLYSMSITMLFALPVLMAYWFAPVIAGWWGVPAFKAMFFSLVASLRNWRPFLVYGLVLMLAMLLCSIVLAVILLFVPVLASVLSLIIFIVFIPISFASYYVIAKDIFLLPSLTGESSDDHV